MRARQNLLTALLMTLVTTALLGLVYPLVITAIAQAFFPNEANGQFIERDGRVVGSSVIAQPFTSAGYFHPRPSAAGYDPTNSGGTNLGPTNRKLIDRVKAAAAAAAVENPNAAVPVDMVTSSASGFDPHITPENAMFQLPRVARARGITEPELREIVRRHIEGRQLGFMGEPRVNVLLLNLDLDRVSKEAHDTTYSSAKR